MSCYVFIDIHVFEIKNECNIQDASPVKSP